MGETIQRIGVAGCPQCEAVALEVYRRTSAAHLGPRGDGVFRLPVPVVNYYARCVLCGMVGDSPDGRAWRTVTNGVAAPSSAREVEVRTERAADLERMSRAQLVDYAIARGAAPEVARRLSRRDLIRVVRIGHVDADVVEMISGMTRAELVKYVTRSRGISQHAASRMARGQLAEVAQGGSAVVDMDTVEAFGEVEPVAVIERPGMTPVIPEPDPDPDPRELRWKAEDAELEWLRTLGGALDPLPEPASTRRPIRLPYVLPSLASLVMSVVVMAAVGWSWTAPLFSLALTLVTLAGFNHSRSLWRAVRLAFRGLVAVVSWALRTVPARWLCWLSSMLFSIACLLSGFSGYFVAASIAAAAGWTFSAVDHARRDWDRRARDQRATQQHWRRWDR